MVAHIDRLCRYEGDLPDLWKSASALLNKRCVVTSEIVEVVTTDVGDTTAEECTVNTDGEQLTTVTGVCRPTGVTGERRHYAKTLPLSGASQYTVQGYINNQPVVSPAALINREVAGARQDRDEPVTRPHRNRRPPARYRRVCQDSAVTSSIGCVEATSDSNCIGMADNNHARAHRRHRERGP